MEEQDDSRRIGARRERPFRGESADVGRGQRNVGRGRPDSVHFFDARAALAPAHGARLCAEKRANLIDFVIGHANLPIAANRRFEARGARLAKTRHAHFRRAFPSTG